MIIRVIVVFSIMIAACSPGFAYNWSTNPGDGSPENPYQISEPNQLIAIGSNDALLDKHFILVNDIVFDPDNNPNHVFHKAVIAQDTNPSLSGFQGVPFTGRLDGQEHTIYNLTINVSGSQTCIGLIGYTENAELLNLNLNHVSITGDVEYVGGLVGSHEGIIKNCHIQVDIHGASSSLRIGGIAGDNFGVITKCTSSGIVTGNENVGGITGLNCGMITYSSSTCEVAGKRFTGGIAGWNGVFSPDSYILNCYSSGNVVGQAGGYGAGGLVGIHASGTMVSCYSEGTVSCLGGFQNIGGLVGDNGGAILNCYSKSTVDAANNSFGIGGFAGYSDGPIKNSYAKGLVSYENGCQNVGAFAGSDNDAELVSNCFFLDQMGPDNGLGKALSGEQMCIESNYAGWDFRGEDEFGIMEYWTLPAGEDSPKLSYLNGLAFPVLAGAGTITEPYLLHSMHDLRSILLYPTNCFRLMDNFDFEGIAWTTEIIPYFNGHFDGNGFALENLKISGQGHIGFWGELAEESVVEDIRFRSVSIEAGSGSRYVGILAPYTSGIIQSCEVDGALTIGDHTEYIGGLTGRNTGRIINCISEVNVECGNECEYIGGVTGENLGEIKRCSCSGTITGGVSTDNIGLIAGASGGFESDIIDQCCAKGAITGDTNLGGLVGLVSQANKQSIIKSSKADVTIQGNYYIGGLVGMSLLTVSDCYSMGHVSGQRLVGGLIGRKESGSIVHSYFLETSGPNNGYGTPLSETVMKQQSSFIGWDFVGEDMNGTNEIWRMCADGMDYPRLSWEFAKNGDFACGNGVDLGDLQAIAEQWLSTKLADPATFNYAGDANGDEQINLRDFNVLCDNWP